MHFLFLQNNSACKWLWLKQGKSEGFESCDRPIVRKQPIWVKVGDVLYLVTLKFDRWPRKTIGHLSVAVSSFVQHLIAIGEFKLELQSRNAQFGSNSMIFRAVWPWNFTYELEQVISNWIQIVNFSTRVTVKFDGWPRKTIAHFFYTTSSFVHHFKSIGEFKLDLQSRNAQVGSKLVICYPVWPWNLMDDLGKQ